MKKGQKRTGASDPQIANLRKFAIYRVRTLPEPEVSMLEMLAPP